MEKYYLLSWRDGKEPLASAFAPEETKLAQDLIPELNGLDKLPFELTLAKLSSGKNGLIKGDVLNHIREIWLDYQPNSLAWPLMSERMKSVIEANLTGNEQIDWIACKVKSDTDERPYFILRFNKMLDVLDLERTIFVQGTDHIIKPIFSTSKINAYNIFPKPSSHDLWKITPGLFISESMKKAIQKQKLSGIDFEKISIS